MELNFTLNGAPVCCALDGSELLLDLLRGPLEQTGTKEGCGKGECGACTVLVEGRALNACLTLAAEVEGCEVTTIEGLAPSMRELAPEQRAFVEQGGIQCGFCSPGMIMSARALLDRDPDPPEAEIRRALVGNLCRCTGYAQIVEAVRRAAELRGEEAR